VATQEERNARLDKLKTAVNDWADKEEERLTKEATLLKKILRGREGSERLNNASVESASDLLVDELDQFLTGE
jgi:hypothetical protein